MAEYGMVLYLCDGTACESPDNCFVSGTGFCQHTTRREHALHPDRSLDGFIERTGREVGKVDLWEPSDE